MRADVHRELSEIDDATMQHQVTERDRILEARSQTQTVERRPQWSRHPDPGNDTHVMFR
jgi:hypothetical protein